MRLNINLASQPYESARRFVLVWGSGLVALAVLTVVLIAAAVSSYMGSRPIAAQTRELNARIAQLDREKTAGEALLNQPSNRELRQRSRFLNTLFARKSFSWTQVFADLEKIMPPRVRVVSIRPDFTPENQLQIHLQAIGDSRDKAIDLVRKLEQSPMFREAWVREEKDQPNGPNSGVEFEIVAQYVPQVEAQQAQSAVAADRKGQ
jgi:type IV pilus assembly protein PilN